MDNQGGFVSDLSVEDLAKLKVVSEITDLTGKAMLSRIKKDKKEDEKDPKNKKKARVFVRDSRLADLRLKLSGG